MSRTVELRIGGQTVRVVSSADEAELQRLAGIVNRKLQDLVPPGKGAPPHGLLLVALALAHDAERERSLRTGLEVRTRGVMRRLLGLVDAAVGGPSLAAADRPG
jgi:cell division protein ZapA